MSTVMVKGQHVKIGDDLWAFGRPHRITRITPYRHPVVTRGEDWRIAHSDGPDGVGAAAWGITLSHGHGYAAHYEVSVRPGEPPYVNEPPEDDYPSPFYGEGAALFPEYQAGGRGLSWREWLASRGKA